MPASRRARVVATLPLALACACGLAIATGAGAQDAGTHPLEQGSIVHTWKPVRRGSAEVVAIEVRTEIAGLPDSVARALSLSVPITYAGVAGIAERTQRLTVRDADGDVPFRVVDDAPDPAGFPFFRHFRLTRAVRSPLVLTYEALAPSTPMRAPPFGLFAAFGGVSGAGSGFLVLPEGGLNVLTRVHWDLSELGEGTSAATSFGDGDFELRGAPSDVMQGWIMAGPIGRFPAAGGARGFSAVWLGTPAFDPAAEMAWTAHMYAWLGKSYGYLRPLPDYRVFIRVGARGGTALGASFMAGAEARGAGAPAAGEADRETFTHEMGHLFVGGIDAPVGVQSWFSEGLNTYYTRLLPMRGGFSSVAEYGRAINADFTEYWNGAARNWSADSIARVGFRDDAVRHMPYMRSSLYFADLDSRIRARSRGRRTLDEVLRELFEARARGETIDHVRWIATVEREAGPDARAMFEGVILDGTTTLVPASDAFGPCFTRRATAASSVSGTRRIAGYEWVRVTAVPDSACRAWGEPPVRRELVERRPSVATSRHTGTFGDVRVAYTATVEEHLLAGRDGIPDASMISIAYVRDDIADRARRPVTFVFNGGPGSSSSPLHMSGLGPRLTAGDSTTPNPASVLDATDLVFIDPVGTGFSRPFTTEAGRRRFWTRSGDAASVAEVIERWLRLHRRERSPRYLAGESYGTVRAGVILRDRPGLRFDGVILVAVVTGAITDDESGTDVERIDALPTMAASAWFHGVGLPRSIGVDQVFADAARLGDSELRDALAAGAGLDAAERERMATRLAPIIGVPVSFLVARDLRLSKDDWMLQLLATRGLRTGMLDTRVTSPRDTTRRGGLNDPSFNGGTMRFGTAMLAPALLPGDTLTEAPARRSALERYLTRDLRFPTRETYRSLNLDINVVWDHEDGGDITAVLADAMRARPAMRAFWTGGYFDLTTPAHAVERAFAAAGMPTDRTTAALLPAAHGVFADEAARTILAARLRAWIR